jgi:hypothetical protein
MMLARIQSLPVLGEGRGDGEVMTSAPNYIWLVKLPEEIMTFVPGYKTGQTGSY